jgi:outer membrane PBP1 activator LpoA protein
VTVRGVVALALLAAACTHAKPLPENPPRIQASPPEQAAALNAAARLGLEAEEQRWQIDAAKELKRQEADRQQSANNKTVIPMPSMNDGGASDGGPDEGAPR